MKHRTDVCPGDLRLVHKTSGLFENSESQSGFHMGHLLERDEVVLVLNVPGEKRRVYCLTRYGTGWIRRSALDQVKLGND